MNKEHEDGMLQSYIKGAPERVLGKCTHFLQDNKIWQITDEFKTLYDEAYSVRHIRRIYHTLADILTSSLRLL